MEGRKRDEKESGEEVKGERIGQIWKKRMRERREGMKKEEKEVGKCKLKWEKSCME